MGVIVPGRPGNQMSLNEQRAQARLEMPMICLDATCAGYERAALGNVSYEWSREGHWRSWQIEADRQIPVLAFRFCALLDALLPT
jgi:hypothetical protein